MAMGVEFLESGKLVASGIAMKLPVSDRVTACSPARMPSRLRQRLSGAKSFAPSSVEEIEAKLRGADLDGQEREYKGAFEAFNEKNKEKLQLITRLMELVSESERMRMKKLEELSKSIETIRLDNLISITNLGCVSIYVWVFLLLSSV